MTTLTRPEGTQTTDLKLSRRALGATFFAGYAVAALSADAAPIHTDDAGLVVETVNLATGVAAYVARPAAKGRYPAVIVVNEIFGIHAYIKDICRRLAKAGYAAVAPAFFTRAGDPAPLSDMQQIMRIVVQASDTQVMGDVQAALALIGAAAWADPKHVAITGYCWGGKVVWNACARFPQIKAGAAWYGRLAPPPGAAADPNVFYPIGEAARLKAPVLGLYGAKDQGIPVASVEAMRAALAAAGKTDSELVVYPNSGHGFHADYRPSYVEADAKDAWARMLSWFAAHGAAPK